MGKAVKPSRFHGVRWNVQYETVPKRQRDRDRTGLGFKPHEDAFIRSQGDMLRIKSLPR